MPGKSVRTIAPIGPAAAFAECVNDLRVLAILARYRRPGAFGSKKKFGRKRLGLAAGRHRMGWSGRRKHMTRIRSRIVRWALAAGATLLAGNALPTLPVPEAPLTRSAEHPNLIVIMGDDIGYSDLGAMGGEIDTPNLDALARRSLRLTNFYNMSRCCPSRASLLTGRYPHRVLALGENGSSLSREVPTVAEELRGAGYATTMIGKWHLTAAVPLADREAQLRWLDHQADRDRDFGDRATYPTARGFDRFWGIVWGVANYFDPFSLTDGETPVRSVPRGFYLTDAISDHAVGEVARLSRGRQPFLMYLAYTAAHWPLMAPEPLIRKYLPRYAGGWERMRRDRYARQVAAGLVDPATDPLPALDRGYEHNAGIAWSQLTPAQRAIQVRKMATHAAMVEAMDRGVGRLIAQLKASGQYENTAILFLIDNGASPEIMMEPGYDRPSATRDGRPIEYGEYPELAKIGSDQTMAGIGSYWASAANTPFRWWKAEAFGGGTRTPFFISWPGHLGGQEGRAAADTAHIIDVTPTLLDLAHVRPHLPSTQPMDGQSLAPLLTGVHLARAAPLFFEHEGSRAVIDGDWKLVARAPGPRSPTFRPWELYHLSTDRTETSNVAGTRPAMVARLTAAWNRWAQDVGIRRRTEPVQQFSD
jgi:arylsulfatase A-like enzyme